MSASQLEAAAAVLGPLVDEVVFVGGATVHLWVTEPGAPPARATDDVDVICEVATHVEYHRLGERLRERGLREAMDEPVICRWRSAAPSLVLDVMPTDPDILGFFNPWYEEAISTAATVALDSGPGYAPRRRRRWSRRSCAHGRAGAVAMRWQASTSTTC